MSQPTQTAEAYGYSADEPGVLSVARSADVVVPLIAARFQPRRVVDLGCGAGDWLHAFLEHGASEVVGYDGPWVPKTALRIPRASFRDVDFYQPFPPPEPCDLAMCLEVGEHLAPPVAARCVEFLCQSANVVLWSAAIPGQGGHEHINEQYQDAWIERFASHGFAAFDLIRPRIWMDDRVSWWYQQNMLVFANDAAQVRHGLEPQPFMATVVHPALHDRTRDPRNFGLREILKHMPHYVGSRVGWKTKR
jgi:hypothetical protein